MPSTLIPTAHGLSCGVGNSPTRIAVHSGSRRAGDLAAERAALDERQDLRRVGRQRLQQTPAYPEVLDAIDGRCLGFGAVALQQEATALGKALRAVEHLAASVLAARTRRLEAAPHLAVPVLPGDAQVLAAGPRQLQRQADLRLPGDRQQRVMCDEIGRASCREGA